MLGPLCAPRDLINFVLADYSVHEGHRVAKDLTARRSEEPMKKSPQSCIVQGANDTSLYREEGLRRRPQYRDSCGRGHMSTDAKQGEFQISTDPARMNVAMIHDFLTRTYWAEGIQESTVRRSIANSLCFGVFCSGRQIGFARVVTDRATFAYLADVFVLEGFRGRGLSKWMMETIVAHPDLQGLRRWLLATRDAHELYRKYGFTGLPVPGRFMERSDADECRRSSSAAVGSEYTG